MEYQKVNHCECGDCDPTNAECIAYDSNYTITVRKFRHKRTGEISTQIPIMELADYEEMQ